MANTKITTNVIADDAVTSDKLGGDLTMPGHVSLADNKELRIGTGNDLVIKHNATDTIFTNTTGNLVLAGSHVYIANAANNEYMGLFIADGAASLRFNNIEELATISGGVYFPNRIGIGTNSPASFYTHAQNLVVGSGSGGEGLTIYSGSSDSGYIGFNDTASNGMQGFIQYNHDGDYMAFAPNGAEKVRITSAGNVGINQTAPVAKLDIKGDTTTYAGMAKIYLTDSNSNSESRNWSIGNGGSGFGHFTIGLSNAKDGDPQASGTHTNPFVIDHTGNIGIGTDSPSTTYDKQLHINASGTGASLKLTDSGSGTGASDGAEVIMYNTNMYVTNREAANMFLQTSANTRMTIDSAGKVGIGITTPGGLPLQTKVSSGDNKLRMTTANKDAFILQLKDASGDVHLGTHTTAGALVIADGGDITMPSQPVAIYGHTSGTEAGGYSYNWGTTGAVSVICTPQNAVLNRGSMYDTSNGRFTAPVAGVYRYAVHGNLYTVHLADGAYFMIQILKNGAHYVYHYENNEANSSSWLYNNMGGLISMAKDDYIQFKLFSNNMSGASSGGFGWDGYSYTHYEFQLLY